jgi:hypothetical protein
MISKTLVKLIDEAIVPALVLVVAKILGVLLVARFKDLVFEVSFKNRFLPLPTLVFSSYQDYVTVNSHSNLVMLGVVSLGLVWILLKANLLHASHISPKMAARLAQLRLSRLVSTTFEAYHQALVWYGFAWFTTILMAFYAYLGLAYKSFALIAFLIVLNLTWFFIFDVEREIIIWQRDQEEK